MTTKSKTKPVDDIYAKAYEKFSNLTNNFSDEFEKERIMREIQLGGCCWFAPDNLSFGMIPDFEVEAIYRLLQEIEEFGEIKEESIVPLSKGDLLNAKFDESLWQKRANKRQQPLRSV